ncbi:MAG: hypothetical protein Q4G03_05705 [Planctomycetia bacterium]|nr:hypothetical protein [Planctomycetia bacterium]
MKTARVNSRVGSFSADITSLSAFTVCHFVVDFVCAFILFRLYESEAIVSGSVLPYFILYNVLAFGLECIIGPFFSLKSARACSCIGCALLIMATFVGMFVQHSLGGIEIMRRGDSSSLMAESHSIQFLVILAITLAGIGNAFFHVGGGIDAISRNIGRYWRGGVFISSGALGIPLGAIYAGMTTSWFFYVIPVVVVALSALSIWAFCRVNSLPSDAQALGIATDGAAATASVDNYVRSRYASLFGARVRIGLLICALVVVLLRSSFSFLSLPFYFTRTTASFSPLLIAVAFFLGKFFGGFMADLFGARLIGALSLVISAFCLCFGQGELPLYLAVFCINVTTSITVVSTVAWTRGRAGLGFGLTTLAFLLGSAVVIGDFHENWFQSLKNADLLTSFGMPVVMLTLLVMATLLVLSTPKTHSKKRPEQSDATPEPNRVEA